MSSVKTDREFLILAAKGAGYGELTEWSDSIDDYDSPHYASPALYPDCIAGQCQSWNPLDDDGDMARMESKLSLEVSWGTNTVTVSLLKPDFLCSISEAFSSHGGDRDVARRYASVKVAAYLGEKVK